MVILNFIHCSPDCQTTLEFLISSKHRLTMITIIPLFAIMVKTKAENNYYQCWDYQIIILPNETCWYIVDNAWSLNMLKTKNKKKTQPKTDEK